jgi:hypothetical protein
VNKMTLKTPNQAAGKPKYRVVTLFILDGARAEGLMTSERSEEVRSKWMAGSDEFVDLGVKSPVVDSRLVLLPGREKETARHTVRLSSVIMFRDTDMDEESKIAKAGYVPL